MARSSRSQRPAQRGYATTVTSGLLISLAVAVALLGHIRLKEELNRLEAEIGRLDREVIHRKRGNEKLQNDYETLISSDGLNHRVREMGLQLVMPGDSARVVLPEPANVPSDASDPLVSRRENRLAISAPAALVRSQR